jgi:hypothetical protein
VAAGAVPTVPVAAAAPPVGAVVGVESVDGVTEVPAEESDSPSAETPGPAAAGPTVIGVVGAVAEVAGDAATAVEAGAVPVGGGGGESEVAGAAPVGVRMFEVAVVGAPRMAEVGEVTAEPDVELLADAVEPGVAVVVPM